jgi:hypothetical protein
MNRFGSIISGLLLSVVLSISGANGQESLPKNTEYRPVAGRRPGIATGPSYGSLIRLGEDLARICSNTAYGQLDKLPPDAPIGLDVFATQGGFDSLQRLVEDDNVQLAIVPADAWFLAHLSTKGKLKLGPDGQRVVTTQKAQKLLDQVSVIMPLNQETVHIVVRSEDLGSESEGKLSDLYSLFVKGKNGHKPRTSIGLVGDSAWITAQTLTALTAPEGKADWGLSELTYDDVTGLEKLSKSSLGDRAAKGVDAVILVGTPPHPALRGFNVPKGWFDKGLTFLPIVSGANAAKRREAIEKVYPFTELKAEDYKELMRGRGSVNALAVTALLAGVDLSVKTNKPRLETNRAQMTTWGEGVVYLLLRNLNVSTLNRTLEEEGNSFGFYWQSWQQVLPSTAGILRKKSEALGFKVREFPESSQMRKMTVWWENQRRVQ